MLAMVVNDNAGCLNARGDWATIASMLAPTGGRNHLFKMKHLSCNQTPCDRMSRILRAVALLRISQ